MKAVVCENAKLELADLAPPEPAKGQVLLNVVRCGICGSDLHARQHADQAADVLADPEIHAKILIDPGAGA